RPSLASHEWLLRVLLLRRAFRVYSVDSEITGCTLSAFAERLEDKVSQSEVLDLFEAALAALDHRKHFRCRERAYPDTSPHPRERQNNEREGKNRDCEVENLKCRVQIRSVQSETNSVEANYRHNSG